jgi:glycosyltransferase involved in cell wall biosynthesis
LVNNEGNPVNEQAPAVSVVMPLFNKERFIESALDSVFGQTFRDYEVIVVDDGSTDGSADRIRPRQSRLRYVRQENAGPGAARNAGIRLARGRYIAFLDADDLWLPEKLQEQVSFMASHPDVAMCSTNYVAGTELGKGSPRWSFSGTDDWQVTGNLFGAYAAGFIPQTSTLMVTSQAMREVGGFPEDVFRGEDVFTWFRVSSRGRAAFGRVVRVWVRVDPSGLTHARTLATRESDILFERLRRLSLEEDGRSSYDAWRRMLYRAVREYAKRAALAKDPAAARAMIRRWRAELGPCQKVTLLAWAHFYRPLRSVFRAVGGRK